ncbi:MAG TPA: squalene/phytoene synthase family protein, partial [Planctomycetota bacterium]|nr:squalene/phytoene synthase family protein [Planctomycetota bacterium]
MTAPAAAVASPEAIAARSGSNFLIGFRFLPAERRTALTAIYAFCRVVDDAVDDSAGPQQAREQLEFWRAELAAAVAGAPATAIGRGLQQAIARFGVDPARLHEVVAGV